MGGETWQDRNGHYLNGCDWSPSSRLEDLQRLITHVCQTGMCDFNSHSNTEAGVFRASFGHTPPTVAGNPADAVCYAALDYLDALEPKPAPVWPDAPANSYQWFLDAPWNEVAALLLACEEDNPTEWFAAKHGYGENEWGRMDEWLLKEHFGDCTKHAVTCNRCVAEEAKARVEALRAVITQARKGQREVQKGN